jgi:hypothetical protein
MFWLEVSHIFLCTLLTSDAVALSLSRVEPHLRYGKLATSYNVALGRYIVQQSGPYRPNIYHDIPSFVVDSDGYADGKNGPTRCAFIGAVLGDR